LAWELAAPLCFVSARLSLARLPQSHVSASVARFRERGTVETAADPDDRRRTLVRLHDEYQNTKATSQ
jgi:DNA-binding MarR family transcriptional regulator